MTQRIELKQILRQSLKRGANYPHQLFISATTILTTMVVMSLILGKIFHFTAPYAGFIAALPSLPIYFSILAIIGAISIKRDRDEQKSKSKLEKAIEDYLVSKGINVTKQVFTNAIQMFTEYLDNVSNSKNTENKDKELGKDDLILRMEGQIQNLTRRVLELEDKINEGT